MQTSHKAKYKHMFLCGVARSGTSPYGRDICKTVELRGLQEYQYRQWTKENKNLYSMALASMPTKTVALTPDRTPPSLPLAAALAILAAEGLKSKHLLAFHASAK